jgi:tight adherence protein C
MIWISVIIFLLIFVGAAWLVVVGLRDSIGKDPLEERLSEYIERGEQTSLEEIELSQPFVERVIYPAAKRFGEIAQKFTPQNALTETRTQLELAAVPRWMDPTLFLASRFVAGLVLSGLVLLLFSLSPTSNVASLRSILLTGLMLLVGFFVPNLMLNRRIRGRQKEILNAMPDALDLLTIAVEAGLGFDAAMKKVVDKWEDNLSIAFARVLQEIQLGRLRREALREMSNRIGLSEMESFVAAVIQSEQLGVSMARVLRVQSDAMRIKRRQRAEENAQRAPVKMLIPMAFLIFPTIIILLLGPAALQIMRSTLGSSLF